MLKRLLFVFVVFASLTASAQIKKGKVGMNASLYLQNTKRTNTSINMSSAQYVTEGNFTAFNYGVGAFLSNSFFAGVTVGYNKSSGNQQSGSTTTDYSTESYPVGLQLKWYKKISSKFYYNINGNATYASVKSKSATYDVSGNYNSSVKGDQYTGRLSPAQITYAISKKFLVEAGFAYIEYVGSKEKAFDNLNSQTGTYSVNTFNVNLSPAVSNFTFTFIF